jgi:hypothetical protein
MKHWLLAASLLLPIAGQVLSADTANILDREISYRSKNSRDQEYTLTIPYLVGGSELATRRINTFLHDQLLETLPDASPGTTPRLLLLDVPLEELRSEGIKQLNKGRTIAVSAYAYGCGAYCTESPMTWHFDSRNGRLIVAQEVLTPAGRAELGRQFAALGAARLKQEIARLEKQIAAHKLARTRPVDEMHSQVAMYQACLDERFAKGGLMYRHYLNDPGAMEVGNGRLSFSNPGCASHADLGLDDLGELRRSLRGEELRPYLNAYGKYLVFGEGEGVVPAINPYSQYFKGTINGTIPVTLFMGSSGVRNDDDQFASAHYYYDKYRKKIALSVRRTGSRFELVETDSKDAVKPVLRFQLKGETLTGQWIGNGKTYPFEAHPL